MKLHAMALAVFAALLTLAAEQAQGDDSVLVIHLPHSMDTTDVTIWYGLAGDFGGACSEMLAKPKVWDYELPTSFEGKPSRLLKAVVYCPGYEVGVIDIPSLAGVKEKSAALDMKPLPKVRLSGHVVMPKGAKAGGFQIRVQYMAEWEAGFFGYIDGPLQEYPVALVDVAADGSFSAMVPDLARDSVIRQVKNPGRLWITMAGKSPYELVTADGSGWIGQIPVAGKYPDALVLYAKFPKPLQTPSAAGVKAGGAGAD